MIVALFVFFCANANAEPFPSLNYADVKPIFDKKCAVCHKGPWLDIRTFPFVYEGLTTQEEIVSEFVRRMRLPGSDWDKMPTRNAKPMTEEEIQLIEKWLQSGLQARR